MQKPESAEQKSTFLRTIRTVAWGLLGVRGHKLNEKDLPALSPLHILITALVFMLVFVLVLVAVAIKLSHP